MACSGRTGKEVSAFKSAEACATELSGNCAELNRQTQEVEHLATYRKQTTAIRSNRQKIEFCETQKVSVLPSLLKIGRRSFWMLIGATDCRLHDISNRFCLTFKNRRNSLKTITGDNSNWF